eukprot:Em0251g1a
MKPSRAGSTQIGLPDSSEGFFADVKWESRLLLWAHETLLKILDSDLLPVYLDILQVLKSKSPVLVEHMIHSSVTREGGEALGLLLKETMEHRDWNGGCGQTAPIFVVLPHASMGVGGRRWRLWHSQLSSIGKVYPVILPEHLTNPCQALNLQVLVEEMVTVSLTRVQELKQQYGARPIVLLGWSIGARLACRIAEVEPVSCIVSLGLPCQGPEHQWKELRSQMDCYTAMVTVGGGDDLLHLAARVGASSVDGTISAETGAVSLIAPSSSRPPHLLKTLMEENFNLNNNSLLWATYLGLQRSSSGSRSSTPSPLCTHDRPGSGELPRIGRPRSKSLNADIAGKKMGVGQKSQSGEQGKSLHSEPPKTPPIVVLGCNSNSNNNNNSLDTSPLQLLTIPPQIVPALPITPPRNPYEDQDHEGLDPKTLKKLQLHK